MQIQIHDIQTVVIQTNAKCIFKSNIKLQTQINWIKSSFMSKSKLQIL